MAHEDVSVSVSAWMWGCLREEEVAMVSIVGVDHWLHNSQLSVMLGRNEYCGNLGRLARLFGSCSARNPNDTNSCSYMTPGQMNSHPSLEGLRSNSHHSVELLFYRHHISPNIIHHFRSEVPTYGFTFPLPFAVSLFGFVKPYFVLRLTGSLQPWSD